MVKMMRFIMHFVVLTVFALGVDGCLERDRLPEPPFALPLVRKKAMDIDFEFRVPEKNLYALGLSFLYPKGDERKRAKVRNLAVGEASEMNASAHGRALILQASVLKKNADRYAVIFDRSIDTEGLGFSSWSDEKFNKELVAFQLEPGNYRVLANVAALDGALKEVGVDLRIARPYRGK